MSSLQKFIDDQTQAVEQSLEAIADLQRQLNELNTQLRVQQQIGQAQKTANFEVEDWLKQGKKLMKDLCSVFPVEALEDLAQEVVEMSQDIRGRSGSHLPRLPFQTVRETFTSYGFRQLVPCLGYC